MESGAARKNRTAPFVYCLDVALAALAVRDRCHRCLGAD